MSARPRPFAVADYLAATRRVDEATGPFPRGPQPRPCLVPGTVGALREFTRRMLGLHQVLPHTSGQMPMCSCGSVARICPVVDAAHELLGAPVPWRPDDPPPRPWTSA